MRCSYSSSSSFLESRVSSPERWSLMQSQISISCSSPSFYCVSPSSSANFKKRMSRGYFTCSNSDQKGSSFYYTRLRYSVSRASILRSQLDFQRFYCPIGIFFKAQELSLLRVCTFLARKAQTAMANLELLSWMMPLSNLRPCCILDRLSRQPCSSFLSPAERVLFCYFLRIQRECMLLLELRLLRGVGDGCLYGQEDAGLNCQVEVGGLYGSGGVRQRLRTYQVMMEVKVVFLLKGFALVGFGFSYYVWTVRSVASSSSHPMRLKWSLTSILLSRSSVFLVMRTLEGKTTAVSSIREMSLAIVFSSKGQNPQSISYSTTPRDHISAFIVYASPFNISGAMQMGEPSMVCERSLASLSGLQKPKSANLSTPLWRRMLLGLMSLCMMLNLIRIWNALKRSARQASAFSSPKRPQALICCSSVPPLQYSQTKQQLLAVLSISMKRTT